MNTTTIKPVFEGLNKFCGPAVLSILTGKSTDECAAVIGSINGKHQIQGVTIEELLKALDRLGFDVKLAGLTGHSLYRNLVDLSQEDGIYVMMLPKHFICIEVNNKQVFFCDNHTKEPIPAQSSARLMQKVTIAYKVTERPKPVLINERLQVIQTRFDRGITIKIYRIKEYNLPQYNLRLNISTFNVNNVDEISSIIAQLGVNND